MSESHTSTIKAITIKLKEENAFCFSLQEIKKQRNTDIIGNKGSTIKVSMTQIFTASKVYNLEK